MEKQIIRKLFLTNNTMNQYINEFHSPDKICFVEIRI